MYFSVIGGTPCAAREIAGSNNFWYIVCLLAAYVIRWHYTILYIDYTRGKFSFLSYTSRISFLKFVSHFSLLNTLTH